MCGVSYSEDPLKSVVVDIRIHSKSEIVVAKTLPIRITTATTKILKNVLSAVYFSKSITTDA